MADDWGAEAAAVAEENQFTLDGTGTSKSDLGGGHTIDQPGKYHLCCIGITEQLSTASDRGGAAYPTIRVDCQVMHTVEGQNPKGCRYFHSFFVGAKGGGPIPDWARENILRFLVGLKLLIEVERDGEKSLVDAQTGQARFNVRDLFQRVRGKHFLAKMAFDRPSKKDDKPGAKQYEPQVRIVRSQVFTLDDPAVADWPRGEALETPPETKAAPPDDDEI